MMNLIDALPDIRGLYLLTSKGELGLYREDKSFVREAELSKTLAEPISQLLAHYRKTQDTTPYRLSIMHGSSNDKPWHSASVAFTDAVLRTLYPNGGRRHGQLTSFQRKNREHSIYRGIELLLNYRQQGMPRRQHYCPILVFRNTTLNQYTGLLDRDVPAQDAALPVVEVIDLLALAANAQRANPAITQLIQSIHANVVRQKVRTEPGLVLIDDVRKSTQTGLEDNSPVEAYAHEDNRELLELAGLLARPGNFDYARWFDAHSKQETKLLLGRWLRKPYEYKDATGLRIFDRFQDISNDVLSLLAAKNPVFTALAATSLLNRGTTDNWNLYLLEGQLELEAADGAISIIEGGTISACRPVSFLKPRMYHVRSLSLVKFLWLYEPIIEAASLLSAKRSKLALAQG